MAPPSAEGFCSFPFTMLRSPTLPTYRMRSIPVFTSWHTTSDGRERKGAMSEDRIFLEDMIFHGRHGTLRAEQELGQPFVVSVELRLDLRPAGISDDLTKTVDYGEVHRLARTVVEGEPVSLIGTLAERICTAVLENYPALEAAKIRVAKPHVRLDGTVLAGSAVEIVRHAATNS